MHYLVYKTFCFEFNSEKWITILFICNFFYTSKWEIFQCFVGFNVRPSEIKILFVANSGYGIDDCKIMIHFENYLDVFEYRNVNKIFPSKPPWLPLLNIQQTISMPSCFDCHLLFYYSDFLW